MRENKSLFIIISVVLFLVELEIFALAAMKSGHKSWMQVMDADGNIHIEGKGVAPTIRVPYTRDTLFSEEDVLLNAAVDYLDGAS